MPPFPASRLLQRLRAVLPADCPICGRRARGGAMCAACAADVSWSTRAVRLPRCPGCAVVLRRQADPCPDCAGRPRHFTRTVIAMDYAQPADLLVLRLKRAGGHGDARLLAGLLADAVADGPPLAAETVLVPIPSSPAALARRGFNPAAEVAVALGRALALPVARGLLRRARDGDQQHRLDRAARARNADGLFRVHASLAGPVAVVDDVMTTGATLDAAAAALNAAGATDVTALVVARTPPPGWRVRR